MEDMKYKMTFELDYALETKYRVIAEPGKVHFENDVPSKYMPMNGIMNFDAGKRNGEYKTEKEDEQKLLEFLGEDVFDWKCYYPNTILDGYIQWKLHVEYEGFEVLTSGYLNDEPENFYDFLQLINNLFPPHEGEKKQWIEVLE